MAFDPATLPNLMRETYENYCADLGDRAVDWSWDGTTLSFAIRDGSGICDFCSDTQGPYALWPADDVVIYTEADATEHVSHRSQGPWASCITCTPIIASDNREALLQRALAVSRAERGGAAEHPMVVAAIRAGHRAYWKARR